MHFNLPIENDVLQPCSVDSAAIIDMEKNLRHHAAPALLSLVSADHRTRIPPGVRPFALAQRQFLPY
jgi:hypothetical protein